MDYIIDIGGLHALSRVEVQKTGSSNIRNYHHFIFLHHRVFYSLKIFSCVYCVSYHLVDLCLLFRVKENKKKQFNYLIPKRGLPGN